MMVERVIPLWQDHLAPRLVDQQNILVVGHEKSLRVLTKCASRQDGYDRYPKCATYPVHIQ